MNHCSHLLPNNGQPTAGQLAQMEAKALKFAQCMRSHGLADFPDPQTVNGGFGIILSRSAHSDLDPHNPRFQAAQAKCGGLMGGPAPGSGTQSSSHGGHK
jgi:hypothetical protein